MQRLVAGLLLSVALFSCGQEKTEPGGLIDCDSLLVAPSTNTDIQALSEIASEFLSTLDEATASQLQYCVGHTEMHSWTNVPGKRSGGIELRQLTQPQQELAWKLVHAFMSDHGFEKARLIATEITQVARAAPLGSHTVAVFGDPRQDGVWGVQLDGHHLALNFLVYGSDLLLAPAFLGTQPRSVDGLEPLRFEANLGHQLISAFNEIERQTAKQDSLIGRDVKVGSGRSHEDRGRLYDVSQFADKGLAMNRLEADSRVVVHDLIDEYVYNLAPPFAGKIRDLIANDFESGFVVFDTRGDDIYYRIYVPNRMLIEYNDINSTHVHTIFRLLGEQPFKDYGAFSVDTSNQPRTIAEHFHLAAHHQADSHHKLVLSGH